MIRATFELLHVNAPVSTYEFDAEQFICDCPILVVLEYDTDGWCGSYLSEALLSYVASSDNTLQQWMNTTELLGVEYNVQVNIADIAEFFTRRPGLDTEHEVMLQNGGAYAKYMRRNDDVVIVVDGGAVQGVYTNNTSINKIVVDYDNAAACEDDDYFPLLTPADGSLSALDSATRIYYERAAQERGREE